ncbi:MAG: hypothetical protein RBU30_13515 [Polyangia bacterium]|jgi:hypothetical protein|nr:hypothetical protein [Polyangia bacterium]
MRWNRQSFSHLILGSAIGALSWGCGSVSGHKQDAATHLDVHQWIPDSSTQNDASNNHDSAIQGDGGLQNCAEATYVAEKTPAALMVLLDRSSSMSSSNKWTFAAQAIVQALDRDAFDGVTLGLYAAPSGSVTGPSCLWGLPVSCLVPPFPDVDLANAGTDKSTDPTGVRKLIRDWLQSHTPDDGMGDASPMYDAITAALGALRGWSGQGVRILLVVTDGTLSCTSLSSRNGFMDCNGCQDWEHPQNLIDLLGAANQDTSYPVETFILGVPGADTYDSSGCNYPPYYMRNALSAMAWAGSPDHAPATCDGTTFAPPGANPTLSCHFDMTQGNFSTQAIADAIEEIRGSTLGCLYDLPEPGPGVTINPNKVNVVVTLDGVEITLGRRSSPTNDCAESPGCWDYTNDGKVELLGAACAAMDTASSAEVSIVVGCDTIVM